jgi:hypothetical protein
MSRKTIQQILIELSCAESLMEVDDMQRGRDYNDLHKALVFFQKSHFDQYIPSMGSDNHDYSTRLELWLNNVDNLEQQAILLEIAKTIAFFSREDMAKLSEAALQGPVKRWIISTMDLNLSDAKLNQILWEEVNKHTWFTSITDSMQISEFHHINHLGGTDVRPDWKSLQTFGDAAKIRAFMQGHKQKKQCVPLKRIVILEDFVGSGTQMGDVKSGCIRFAAQHFHDYKILLCPLLCCPGGAERGRRLESAFSNLTFEPVIELGNDDLLTRDIQYSDGSFRAKALRLCNATFAQVNNGPNSSTHDGPLGFKDTGAMVVMYTNTPNNTLPIIQCKSQTWEALFPRSARMP